jgi:glutamate synthase (NADPH/NADH) large chain
LPPSTDTCACTSERMDLSVRGAASTVVGVPMSLLIPMTKMPERIALSHAGGGLAVILGETGRNLGAGMSGGTAYIHSLDVAKVNSDARGSGELQLTELGSVDREIVRDLLERHVTETGSPRAAFLLEHFASESAKFTKVLPRDYAAVLETRRQAEVDGLDPDGDVTWQKILEVTGG